MTKLSLFMTLKRFTQFLVVGFTGVILTMYACKKVDIANKDYTAADSITSKSISQTATKTIAVSINWMANLSDDVPVSVLSLPGVTIPLPDQSPVASSIYYGIDPSWLKSTKIRALEINVTPLDGLQYDHVFFKLVRTIRAFLKENPSETFVLKIKNVDHIPEYKPRERKFNRWMEIIPDGSLRTWIGNMNDWDDGFGSQQRKDKEQYMKNYIHTIARVLSLNLYMAFNDGGRAYQIQLLNTLKELLEMLFWVSHRILL